MTSRLTLQCTLAFIFFAAGGFACGEDAPPKTVLGSDGSRFTVDGKPVFLLGVSYYAGLAAGEKQVRADLDEIKRRGFNWLRVWATWSGFDHNVSAVDGEGRPRPEYLEKLVQLVAQADARGLIVDVTLTRGEGNQKPPGLQTTDTHTRAALTLAEALRDHRNWFLDLANERNIGDKRFASMENLKAVRDAVKQQSGGLLVTASHGGDISEEDVGDYLKIAGVDFLAPHRPRDKKSLSETAATTRQLLKWASAAGKTVPILYQEPFRRDYGGEQPTADDFLADLRQARESGAAGWCLHNDSNRHSKEGHPRRSFDLRGDQPFFDRLDDVERDVVKRMSED
jgi:hypothetical protein